MSSSPTVSVIIPAYNRAHYIKRAIESVKAQTYRGFEIVVVDDGSTEDLRSVVSLCGPDIRYIRHERNLGSAEARNRGIREARGQFVAFLDSDDIWLPEKLDRQVNHILSQPEPYNTVCYCQVIMYNGAVKVLSSDREIERHEHIAEYLFKRAPLLQSSSLLLSKKLLLHTKFDKASGNCDDLDLSIRLHAGGAHFSMVKQPLLIFFNDIREDRVSCPQNFSSLISWLDARKTLISDRARKRILAHRAWSMYKGGEKKFALTSILNAAFSRSITPVETVLFLLRCFLPRRAVRIYHRLKYMLQNRRLKEAFKLL
ncbi:MAG TPA: glycosyltransferase family 2 protein [Spirochaetota bacterium]|nr:glycosyltransferase family 2 protein [Spirochaetota bacterium]